MTPSIPCTIDYGRLVEAINEACQQLHVVHVEATASALGIVADAAAVKK